MAPALSAMPTLPQAGSFQCMAGWLGLVSGGDLAQQCGRHYPLPARLLLWAVLEATIVAADVQGIVGCAQALSMLTRGQLPLWAGGRGGRLGLASGGRSAVPVAEQDITMHQPQLAGLAWGHGA